MTQATLNQYKTYWKLIEDYSVEIPINTINGWQSAIKHSTERVVEFIKNWLLPREVSFSDHILWSTIVTSLK